MKDKLAEMDTKGKGKKQKDMDEDIDSDIADIEMEETDGPKGKAAKGAFNDPFL